MKRSEVSRPTKESFYDYVFPHEAVVNPLSVMTLRQHWTITTMIFLLCKNLFSENNLKTGWADHSACSWVFDQIHTAAIVIHWCLGILKAFRLNLFLSIFIRKTLWICYQQFAHVYNALILMKHLLANEKVYLFN